MATDYDKENIADGLLASSNQKRDAPSPKKTKKSRSLSMGPGALNVPLKEDAGNRRKVGEPPSVTLYLSLLTIISPPSLQ
jgi:kinetochore protein Spc7/SPC105